MVQMRTTWAARDSLDKEKGLTGPLPPSPLGPLCLPPLSAGLGGERAPWCWTEVRRFVGAGGKFVGSSCRN